MCLAFLGVVLCPLKVATRVDLLAAYLGAHELVCLLLLASCNQQRMQMRVLQSDYWPWRLHVQAGSERNVGGVTLPYQDDPFTPALQKVCSLQKFSLDCLLMIQLA